MTGLPATFTSGLGTRLVSGRSRVPLPAIGMMTFMSGHSSVAILQAHDVVDLGRRDFQQVARDDGLELMDLFGGNVKILAGFHPALGELFDAGNGVGHASRSFREEGTVTHAVTHTPQPTQPSGFSTGRPRSSSASAFSPIGHARAQTPHSAPWNVMQRCGSSSRIPMCTCSQGTLVRALVSHAAAHGMSSHAMHARDAGSI